MYQKIITVMDNKKGEIRLIQMNKYVRPEVKETNMKDWVLNGQYNSFYQYIIDRFNGSSTNAAIINSYIDLTFGQGLQNLNTNISDWIKFQKMIGEVEVKKIISDFILYGEAAIQIIKAKGSGKLPTLYHLPKENTAPKKVNEDNVIEGYYYSEDWRKANIDNVDFLPILSDSKETESYVIRPYKAGKKYFSDPDYLAGLPYADLEEEIANYYISHIRNGLSFGYIINIPDGNSYTPEEKDEIERKIKQNLVGSSNAGKFVINFNGRDAEITVTTLDVADAHKQWEYLTGEARQQLLTAHRVTSPMLFGIKDNTGLGNNADELDVAEAQLMKRVIQPKQKYITSAFEDIAAFYGLVLDLRFKPLTEQLNVQEEVKEKIEFNDVKIDAEASIIDKMLDVLAEDAPIGYAIDRIEDVGDESEEEDFAKKLNEINFASIESAPTTKSREDSPLYKVRYRYKKAVSGGAKSRDFCVKMHALAGNKKFFRKEDIGFMSAKGVNKEHGHNGRNYSIWKYKGGVNCHDVWERVIFKKQTQEDGKPMIGNPLQNVDKVKTAPGLEPLPRVVETPPINMPNNGHHPNYKG